MSTSIRWSRRMRWPDCVVLCLDGGIRPTLLLPESHGKRNSHKIEMEDYTNFSMMIRFLAGALGLPYAPVNSLKGSDMMKYSSWMGDNKVSWWRILWFRSRTCPCSRTHAGYRLHPWPASRWRGQFPAVGNYRGCSYSMRACKQVIVSVEEIVSRTWSGGIRTGPLFPAIRSLPLSRRRSVPSKNSQGITVWIETLSSNISENHGPRRLEEIHGWVGLRCCRSNGVLKKIHWYFRHEEIHESEGEGYEFQLCQLRLLRRLIMMINTVILHWRKLWP